MNGALEGRQKQTQVPEGAALIIGAPEYKGAIDEVMKWGRALSDSEIMRLFSLVGG